MLHKIIKNIALIITGIILLIFCIAWMASWVPPAVTIIPTYLVMLMPIWWILLIISICFWLWRKKWGISIFLAAILIVSFPQWRNVIVINQPFKNKHENKISILTYNIHLFQNQHKFKEIVELIKETDADIVCLQEFGFYNKLGYSQQEILETFDAIYPYRHLWYKNQNKISQNGVATFSKFPIINKKKIEYSSANNISIYSDIVINDDTIRIMNNHLESNKLNYKDREITKIIAQENNNDEILNVSKDVNIKLGTAAKNRAKQAEVIKNTIKDTPYYTIVVGDFNDVAGSYTYQTIKGNLQDAYSLAGKWGYNWTYHENNMFFAIDHILVDKNFNIQECKVLKKDYSDHYPLYTQIYKHK